MNRYITRGIQLTLPVELVMLIWQWLDEKMPVEKDYLQVINIAKGASGTEVTISQEVPEYERKYVVSIELQEDYKLFCVEEADYQTLMLADEY